jgi:hypothetical protein
MDGCLLLRTALITLKLEPKYSFYLLCCQWNFEAVNDYEMNVTPLVNQELVELKNSPVAQQF